VEDERNAADDLLERARRLEERAADSAGDAPKRIRQPRQPEDDDIAWIWRKVRSLLRLLREIGKVFSKLIQFSGPLRPVFRFFGRGIKRIFLFLTCARDDTGVRSIETFSAQRLFRSAGIIILVYVVLLVGYVYGTRREGIFLINNFHLIDGESDVYQVGGCMKRSSTQVSCDEGEAEIVLIRPAWIPGMGINAFAYDEDVGQIPIQGECNIGMYGWYLRGPKLTRGLLKPVAYRIDRCTAVFPTQ